MQVHDMSLKSQKMFDKNKILKKRKHNTVSLFVHNAVILHERKNK